MRHLKKVEIKRLSRTYKRNYEIVILLENIDYARNVASIFRIADAAGVAKIYLAGISQTPPFGKELQKVSRLKEKRVKWEYTKSINKTIENLKRDGFYVIAVDLLDNAFPILEIKKHIKFKTKLCFVFGNEVYGITKSTLEQCDAGCFVPMYGKGASLNVAMTAAVILFGIY